MTMSVRQARTRIAALQSMLENLSRDLPAAVGVERSRFDSFDGWPAGGDGACRGSGDGSTVESAVLARSKIATGDEETDALDDVADWLGNASIGLSLVTQWCARRTPRLDISDQKCSGGPASEEWSNLECSNLVDHYALASGHRQLRADGLCSACRKRRDRAERDAMSA